MKNLIWLGSRSIDLNNVNDLQYAISFLTDGVYSSSDTASFNKTDVDFIKAVRLLVNKNQ